MPQPAQDTPLSTHATEKTGHGRVFKKDAPALLTVLRNDFVGEQQFEASSDAPAFKQETRHLVLDLKGYDDIVYPAGHSLGIIPFDPELNDFNPKKFRLYSIASSLWAPEVLNKRTVSLCVTRVVGPHEEKPGTLFEGLCSNYVCNLKPGDTVRVTGPSGASRFLLPEKAQDFNYIFIANGTGIAPFRAMLRELDAQKKIDPVQAVWLFFGFRFAKYFTQYQAEIAELQSRHPNFYFRPAISHEAPDQKYFVQHALWDNKDGVKNVLPLTNTRLYLCGGKAMQTGVEGTLKQIAEELPGWDLPVFLDKKGLHYFPEVY